MKNTNFLIALGVFVLLSGCAEQSSTEVQHTAAGSQTLSREVDFMQLSRGGRLFAQNCAECHGASGEGAANWRQRDADGLFPAPPLNGTGHAWHHPQKMLHYVIKHGSPGGQGRMPAWKEKLDDEEIAAIIAWFQSKWPDEVYAAWYRTDQRTRSGS